MIEEMKQPEALRLADWLDETETDYLEPLDHVATELRRLYEENEQLKATPHAEQTVALIKECRDAFAEELSQWDIDPPIHHVKQGHDNCVKWLADHGIK